MTTMRAWFIRSYGDADVLEQGTVPRPEPGPRDVLIAVRAASVNPIDWKMREGKLRRILPFSFPVILGNDLSGVVVARGAEVTDLAPGDQVYARPDKRRIGTFADYIAVRADEVARKPASLSHAEAASLPLVGLTAWQALVDVGKVEPGHEVLILAGAGGVGTFAIQLARHLGARITTTASQPKHAFLRELGADRLVDYRTEKLADLGSVFHVIFDAVGGKDAREAFAALRPGGVFISISSVPDPQLARDWGMSLPLRVGVRLLSWPTRRRAARQGGTYRYLLMRSSGVELGKIAELVEAGVIKPVIDRTFPFAETDEAMAYTEKGRATGKVVIVNNDVNDDEPVAS